MKRGGKLNTQRKLAGDEDEWLQQITVRLIGEGGAAELGQRS